MTYDKEQEESRMNDFMKQKADKEKLRQESLTKDPKRQNQNDSQPS